MLVGTIYLRSLGLVLLYVIITEEYSLLNGNLLRPVQVRRKLRCSLLSGIKHLIALGSGPAIVESDFLRDVQTISGTGREFSGGWALYQEARDLLCVFGNISVSKVDRVCNGVAHVLAQLGKSGFNGLLRDASPPCVEELITLDVT
jgi:hypothetical protein